MTQADFPTPKPQRILIVEDDAPIRELYSMKLIAAGYDLKTAVDGQTGLALAEHWQPDLILLDLRIPVMSGDEILKRMRSTAWGSRLRVIILTNISKSEAPQSLRLLNVDRYITKVHHTPAQIVEVISEILA